MLTTLPTSSFYFCPSGVLDDFCTDMGLASKIQKEKTKTKKIVDIDGFTWIDFDISLNKTYGFKTEFTHMPDTASSSLLDFFEKLLPYTTINPYFSQSTQESISLLKQNASIKEVLHEMELTSSNQSKFAETVMGASFYAESCRTHLAHLIEVTENSYLYLYVYLIGSVYMLFTSKIFSKINPSQYDALPVKFYLNCAESELKNGVARVLNSELIP